MITQIASMWDEILASEDYLNQMASSLREEDLLFPECKNPRVSEKASGFSQVELAAENEKLKNRAIDYLREFGYEKADISCLCSDPWALKREERFWFKWKKELPESFWSDPSIKKYKDIYASHLALEPPKDPARAGWLWERLESFEGLTSYEPLIWKSLSRALCFEQFLHRQFVGQKRFSLEGSETIIPVLEVLFREFAKKGGKHVALGMTHRGRLNVLAHCLNKPYAHILKEFDPSCDFNVEDMGDVKYHKGYASWREFEKKKIFVEMLANPSHLESVGPVLVGFCAAQQRQKSFEEVLPILFHGDAALSGQGVVYETLQLSGVKGYGPAGVIHLVINNQLGFTATPSESRHTEFCTDIAKTFGCPVFHASVEKPLECVKSILLAFEYRQKFKSDVFVDLIGYRKWGHNESDEPRYTNPSLYEKIDGAPSILDIYANQIGLDDSFRKEHVQKVMKELETSFEENQHLKSNIATLDQLKSNYSEGLVEHFLNQMRSVDTSVTLEEIQKWAKEAFELPQEAIVHSKLRALYAHRLEVVESGKDIDWACAEILSYASLLQGEHNVRLSGQDSIRGTFSHRQCGLIREGNDGFWFPLQREKGVFEAYNSPLSEFAVLGFEYGYSLVLNEDLVIWEAQFGDFANGAQVIIDQFISSAQSKWGISSPLVLMLPHGFEGQGPEHSSARIERFLALSARANWCVAQVSTPAQLFHLIRRQVLQSVKRPLILFTPKGLLRHPECVSGVSVLASSAFKEILSEINPASSHVVLCSGRFYYDIHQRVKESGASLIRIEQLYPLAIDEIFEVLGSLKTLKKVIWIQEEPINMGPAVWIRQNLQQPTESRGLQWIMLGRDRSNCIATGYPKRHKLELELLIQSLDQALLF